MAAVLKISQALASMTSLDDLERETLGVSLETLDARAGAIYLYDEQIEKLVFKYVLNFDDSDAGEVLIGRTLEPNQGIAGEVFVTGVPSMDDDPNRHQGFLREVGEGTGYLTTNMLTLPLVSMQGTKIGVMQVLNKSSGNFDQEDLELLTIMAAHASNALVNARLYEEARAAAIMHYLGDISHDIKNVMTPGYAGAQTLEIVFEKTMRRLDPLFAGEGDPAEALSSAREAIQELRDLFPEMIGIILESIGSAQAQVRQIAEAVKGVTSEPFFEDADVNEIIVNVVVALQRVAERQGIGIAQDLGSLPLIPVDRKRLYSAIYNLVNNALPETPAGGTITLKTEKGPQERTPNEECIQITVSDTGRGMPEDVKARLFTPNAVSTKPGGTGLGTRIVKNVIDAHQGTIRVESEPGQGTTFYIELPLRQK
jgi:signal transduction histidine kinase